jgi:DNA-binding transcriptional ArsR family regulator
MKPGPKPDQQITENILNIISKQRNLTAEAIRRRYSLVYKSKKTISWRTIRKHLDELVEEGIIKEEFLFGKKRRIAFFKINNIYKAEL